MKSCSNLALILFGLTILILSEHDVVCQPANEAFQRISTLVRTETPEGTSSGTAFFYQQMGPKKPGDQPQWVTIENVWLVTNRHVLVPEFAGKEVFPTSFTFNMRRIDGNNLQWEPITLSREELLKRAKFHPDPTVDVCIVNVLDLLTDKLKDKALQSQKPGENTINLMPWHGVSKDDFAGSNKITVEAGDDVLVIGYPHGFYDQVNLFPIIKAGIIASKWGVGFKGQRFFLVDAKLFPNSSGSIVVSKPTNFVISGDQIFSSQNKRFAFLGIYAGEYSVEENKNPKEPNITNKISVNLGIVWYADVIEEVIEKGEVYKPPGASNK
jgi:hypothetical protein